MQVRLTESADQCAGAFSGGMKRRLSVAVALAGNPEVVRRGERREGGERGGKREDEDEED